MKVKAHEVCKTADNAFWKLYVVQWSATVYFVCSILIYMCVILVVIMVNMWKRM